MLSRYSRDNSVSWFVWYAQRWVKSSWRWEHKIETSLLNTHVQGHISNVSPLKDKKKPYFEATLQNKGKRSHIMVFRPQEHMHFQSAEKTWSEVTLQNVVISPYKTNGTTNVYYTHNSKMSCVRDLRHAFKSTLPDKAHHIKLSELLKLDLKPKRVNITVKIILEEFKGNNVVRDRRRYLSNTVYTAADTTGYISLTVWCEEITVGEWYKITNVSIKQFNGKTTLSTTKDTEILNIPSQGTAVDVKVPIQSIKCEIIGVSLKSFFICPDKHKLMDLIESSPSVYCASCKTHYKTTAIIMKISGRLHAKPEMGNIIKARVEDEVIRSAVAVTSDASLNDIIQALMSLPPMQMTIVKMESQTSLSVTEPVKHSCDFSPPDIGLFSSQPQKPNRF